MKTFLGSFSPTPAEDGSLSPSVCPTSLHNGPDSRKGDRKATVANAGGGSNEAPFILSYYLLWSLHGSRRRGCKENSVDPLNSYFFQRDLSCTFFGRPAPMFRSGINWNLGGEGERGRQLRNFLSHAYGKGTKQQFGSLLFSFHKILSLLFKVGRLLHLFKSYENHFKPLFQSTKSNAKKSYLTFFLTSCSLFTSFLVL